MQIYDIALDPGGKELTKHGEEGFPFAVYRTQISRNLLGHVAWHWHEELQFCLVTEGAVEFCVKDCRCLVREGEGIFINAGRLHRGMNPPGEEGIYYCINVHPDLLAGFAGSRLQMRYVLPFIRPSSPAFQLLRRETPWQKEILDCISAMVKEENERGFGYEMQILAALLQAWHLLSENLLSREIQEDRHRWEGPVKAMIEYLHAHYQERFSLEGLSQAVNFSPSYCCKLFRKYMQCTLSEYLLDYRLMRSRELLLGSEESITEIAYRCGFSTASSYIAGFRRKSGVSPLNYRKNAKKT